MKLIRQRTILKQAMKELLIFTLILLKVKTNLKVI